MPNFQFRIYRSSINDSLGQHHISSVQGQSRLLVRKRTKQELREKREQSRLWRKRFFTIVTLMIAGLLAVLYRPSPPLISRGTHQISPPDEPSIQSVSTANRHPEKTGEISEPPASEAPQNMVSENAAAKRHAALSTIVQHWAECWSQQDIQCYLDAYSADHFIPDNGLSMADWRNERVAKVQSPQRVAVNLGSLNFVEVSNEQVTVIFQQHYQSDTYEDLVEKTLVLVPEGNSWKISRETGR